MKIRKMQYEDEQAVRKLVMRYLKETADQGGDFPATLENAAGFTAMALNGAAEGDPCLVAEEDGKVVGFHIALGIKLPGLTTTLKSIRSWGTYVLAPYRSKNVGISLLIISGRLAKLAGYDRFIGMATGTGYGDHATSITNRIPGMVEVGKVLVMDLSRKSKEEPANDSVVA